MTGLGFVRACGTVAACALISAVLVACGASVGTLGGSITGLTSSGLVLRNEDQQLTVAKGSTSFQFPGNLKSESTYSLTVQTQPTGLLCTVSDGEGRITDTAQRPKVECVPDNLRVGGTITGLTQDGLVLANGTNVVHVKSTDTSFALPGAVSYGSAYEVTVQTQPRWGRCNISNGAGVVRSSIDDVVVACQPWADVTTVAGSDAMLLYPRGIARASNGDIYIADSGNATLRKMTPAGAVTTVSYGNCTNLTSLTVDASDNLYVLDPAGNADCKDDAGGAFSRISSGQELGMSVVVDRAGNLYVSELFSRVIRKIAPNGDLSILAGELNAFGNQDGTGAAARFEGPSAMAIDKDDNIFVADNSRIRKITPQGVVTTLPDAWGEIPDAAPSAESAQARGLMVGDDGTLYLSHSQNFIRMISPSGTVTTLAGSTAGFVDGNGTAAKFSNPGALTLDASGALYVVDELNNAIRKVSP